MSDKSKHEEEVLKEFLEGLSDPKMNPFLVGSRIPPEPDLLVKFPESEEYFEIARILDKKWVRLRLKALRIAAKLVKVNAKMFGLPERDILISKLSKAYTTNSKVVNLLLYYDTDIYYGAVPLVPLEKFYNNELLPLIKRNPKFKKVYIYDRITRQVLWTS